MNRRRREISLAVAILATCAAVALGAPAFFAFGNLRGLALDALPLWVAALGMTLVLTTGQIDVSVGAQFAVCGVVSGLAARAGAPAPLVLATTVAAGALLGALNGFLVAAFRLPSILVTLATMAILRGTLRWASGGAWIQDLPGSYVWFGFPQPVGQALFLAAAVLIALGVWVFARWTSAGRAIAAVGSSAENARLLGLRPERVLLRTFVLAGALVGAAALVHFPRYPAVEIEAGIGFELEVIACVVVGGTRVQGGRGSLAGTLLGVVLLSVIGTVLVFLRVDAAWERAFQGAILLAAVALDARGARRRGVRGG